MKHPTEDHSLFGIDVINELVEEYMQLDADSVEIPNFVELPDVTDCFDSVTDVPDSVSLPNMYDGDLECSSCARIRVANIKRPVVAKMEIEKEAEFDSKNQEGAESDSNNQEEVEFDSNNQEEAESDSNY
ncbi:hypothetical protein CR513_58111, partial [Mucuna pruriens]